MDDFPVIDLTKGKKRNYSKLYLRKNPFPNTAIPEEVPMLNVDREKIIMHFKEIVNALSESTTPSVTVIIGQYGDGKTHLLRLFKYSVNSQLFDLGKNDINTLAIYVRSPGKNFLEFFGELIEDVGRGTLQKISHKIITDYIDEHRTEAEKFVIGSEKKILPDFELADLLRQSMTLDLFKKLRSKVFADLSDPDILYAILFLSHPDYSSLAWRWLLGEKLSTPEKERILVESLIDNKEKAYKQYKNLLNLLSRVGIASLVILVDELERIILIPGLQKAQYYDELRHMIDDSPKATCYFFAIAPTQWNKLTEEPSALARRLSENVMHLEAFDEARIRQLIAKHIKFSRITSQTSEIKSSFQRCDADLAPFTEDAIKAIYEATHGNVFANLVLCRKLIDYCIDNFPKINEISEETVKKFVAIEGL